MNLESEIGKENKWHQVQADSVLETLDTSASGLTQDEAAARLAVYGRNCLPQPAKRSVLVRFLMHFHNILIYVLLGSAVITAALGHLVDTLVILAVVVANAAIGFVQEGKAEKAMDAIHRMLALRASVLREGDRRTVDGESLVPGDIVLLEAGDKVPADLRLIQANGLQVQEAILTGESVPVDKHTRAVATDAALGDRMCMAFSGTLVTSGLGRGVVVATGSNTEIGRISGMLSTVEVLTTPLVRQMNVFAQWLTILILLIGDDTACLRVFRRAFRIRRNVHGGGGPVGRRHTRRPARCADNHACSRRAGHGAAQCHRPPLARHRDAGLGIGDLHRQDRHADPQRDDGRLRRDADAYVFD